MIYRIEKDGQIQHVAGEMIDGEVAGYPGWIVAAELPRVPDDEIERVVDGAIVEDVAAAEAVALRRLDEAQDDAERGLFRLSRLISTLLKWYELQDLKSVPTATVQAMAAADRQARRPFLTMLAVEAGASLAQTATIVEEHLGPRVRKIAIYEARAEMARRAIRSGKTGAEKLAAAENVGWE